MLNRLLGHIESMSFALLAWICFWTGLAWLAASSMRLLRWIWVSLVWNPVNKLVLHFLAANFRDVQTGKVVTEVTMENALHYGDDEVEAVLHVRTVVFTVIAFLGAVLSACLIILLSFFWGYLWEPDSSSEQLESGRIHGSYTRVKVSQSWKFIGFNLAPYKTEIKPSYVLVCEEIGEKQFKMMYHGDRKMRPRFNGNIQFDKRVVWLEDGPEIVTDEEFENRKLE